MSLQNLAEDFLYDLLPEGIIDLDEQGLIQALVGGYQDRIDDLRSYTSKLEVLNTGKTLPETDSFGNPQPNAVICQVQTPQGRIFSRSLDIKDDTPADGSSDLITWAANQLQLDSYHVLISAAYGVDMLRLVDANILANLASTVGAVLYQTAAMDPANALSDARRLLSTWFPRLQFKGTAQSFEALGRLLGFDDVIMTPLFGRLSPRIANDVGDPENDQDFAAVPDYWPKQVRDNFYDPLVLNDGPFYTWTGTASARFGTNSTDFYTEVVNGFNPFISVKITGTSPTDPSAALSPFILTGGGPQTKASVSPAGSGLLFEAISAGSDFNGMEIHAQTVQNGTYTVLSVTDRLSALKYRTSYFDLAMTLTFDHALARFGTNVVSVNKNLVANPSSANFGTEAQSPYRPWSGGSITQDYTQQDWLHEIDTNGNVTVVEARAQADLTGREFSLASISAAGAQVAQSMEEVRPATRLPRHIRTGFLIEDQTGYASFASTGTLFTTSMQVPAAPSLLAASTISDTEIDLSWQNNTLTGVTSIRIERKTGVGGTYAEIASVGGGSTTYPNTGLTASTTYYYRIRAENIYGFSVYSNEASATTNAPPTNWATRVVANGGPLPSVSTQNAMETLRTGLISAGLDTKILTLCVFVPDSVIAASTPLIFNKGTDPWTNHNFVSGDLTAEGLKGDGSTKWLDTGVQAKSGDLYAAGTGDCGFSIVITESDSNVPCGEMGIQVGGAVVQMQVSGGGVGGGSTYFSSESSSTNGVLVTPDFGRAGYVSGNVLSGAMSVYTASPEESFATLGTFSGSTAIAATTNTVMCFGVKVTATPTSFTSKRLSVACIHTGLTSTESQTLWTLFKACRDSLGGGNGSRVEDWAAKIVRLGGSAPSTGTKDALKTMLSALNTAGIESKMVALNIFVPDSFTAAITPLIWRAGNEQWTNHNFVSGDLSTSGLQGDGSSKYLDTGIITQNIIGLAGLSNTSAGYSAVIALNPSSTNGFEIGSGGTVSFSQFALHLNGTSTSVVFQAFTFQTLNTTYISGGVPSATFAGFISASRTASNLLTAYAASTSLTFGSIASGTGANTTTLSYGNFAISAFAYNAVGTITNFNNRTLSFLAFHSGLSSTETQALYNAVAACRTSLGGGNP